MRSAIVILIVCVGWLFAQSPQKNTLSFTMTPEMYASLMAQSLKGTFPKPFKHENLEVVVHNVRSEKKQSLF